MIARAVTVVVACIIALVVAYSIHTTAIKQLEYGIEKLKQAVAEAEHYADPRL